MGFPVRSEFTKENHNEAGISRQCNDQRTDHFAAEVATFFDFSRNFSTQKTNSWLSKGERQFWARHNCTLMHFVCFFYKNNVSSSVVSMHRMSA